ncbi:hypothetical protein [Clostridium cylindrosporum]|uniref:Uncharacterized protein n=1 Tax=Clostridium cylindrosporum DSM 605 TaxID=1121307 RepID=A0A0J8D882_CLOCY|nr:hypothetical protein [Clostridium cylindrosporum]KMT22072.1 hypothetical protein CLCY_4c00440 [Clostridium cylindrosporum DSM 605]
MNKGVSNKKHSVLIAILFLFIMLTIAFFRSNLIWHSNINKYLEKTYQQPISIKEDKNFSYKGRNYRIILSTPKNKKDELYLQCFEELLNGTFYKGAYGARQGESKPLYGAVLNFINDGTEDSFVAVYGYNKGLKANTFSVKSTNDGKWITQNISKEEYFLYIYTNIVYPEVNFKDNKNNDVNRFFDGKQCG